MGYLKFLVITTLDHFFVVSRTRVEGKISRAWQISIQYRQYLSELLINRARTQLTELITNLAFYTQSWFLTCLSTRDQTQEPPGGVCPTPNMFPLGEGNQLPSWHYCFVITLSHIGLKKSLTWSDTILL